jgi:hypothetical protein
MSHPQVQLRDLRLLKGACALGVGPVPKVKQSIAVKVTLKPDEVNTAVTITEFELSSQDQDGREGPHIEAAFYAEYTVDGLDEIAPEEVAEFLPAIALGNAWPYWREFVQSMAVRMGLPPLRVPALGPGMISEETQTITTQTTKRLPEKESAKIPAKKGRSTKIKKGAPTVS